MVFVKNLKIFYLFIYFLCVRQYSGKEKKASLDYKKQKVKKSQRLRIFPKGLVHGFGQKFEIFPCFYY